MATITPPPGANRAVAAGQANVVVGAVKAGKKEKPGKEKADKPKQPSKEALAVHRKWQMEAEKLGGGKIEVSKPKAKKIIFDMLHDKFRPMNITEIYQVSYRSNDSIVLFAYVICGPAFGACLFCSIKSHFFLTSTT
jgi:hypothetical protein